MVDQVNGGLLYLYFLRQTATRYINPNNAYTIFNYRNFVPEKGRQRQKTGEKYSWSLSLIRVRWSIRLIHFVSITIKLLIITTANDILKYQVVFFFFGFFFVGGGGCFIFFIFQKKEDISCKSIHMKCQVFSLRKIMKS